MEYLRLEEVSKSFGHKILFDRLNLTISQGDKMAIIARNGSGKTTLLKVIYGLEPSDGENSRVLLNSSIKTAYLSQNPDFSPGLSIIEAIYDSEIEPVKAIREYEAALANGEIQNIEEALSNMEDHGGWDFDAKAKEILFKLNLTDLDHLVHNLSGGQKKRVALAKIILSQPDFIILDEPTNHLDIEMIEWLENYLSSSSLTLLMVTHDRYFMERVCNQIIELDKGQLYKYMGNYSDYLMKKALRTEQEAASLGKSKKLYLKELDWVRRQPQARGTKAKSRVNDYHDLKDRLSSIQYDSVFEIAIDSSRMGKKIVEFYDISKGYDGHTLVKNFWYKFRNGEKVGISGPNGCGKTTFIKLITGELKVDSGKIVRGETVQFGHYNQDGMNLEKDKRVIDVIRDVAEFIPLKKGMKLTAAKLLEKFMFEREQQEVFVSQLSGGEKKRLHLLQLLMSNPNFLILDEPTNDLDVLTLNVLEDYLEHFPGCVVIVSHDRYFMDKLVDHMFIFTGHGHIQDYNGTYSEWKLNNKNAGTKAVKPQKISPSVKDGPKEGVRKLSYNEKKEMRKIEVRIADLENRKNTITELFSNASISSAEIESLSIELGQINLELEEIEMRWLELSEYL